MVDKLVSYYNTYMIVNYWSQLASQVKQGRHIILLGELHGAAVSPKAIDDHDND